MEPQRLQARQGWEWIKRGYALFMMAPLLWIVFLLIFFISAVAVSNVPVIGDPLASLLMPVVLAGLMTGCRSLEQGGDLELVHFFSGFKQHTSLLITLGGISLVGQFLILGVMMATGGAGLVGLLTSGQPDINPNVLMEAMSGAIFAISLGVALYLFLTSVVQFATLLVYFNGIPPIPAMQLAIRAFVYNIRPMLVFGVTFLFLGMLATLPMGLGWLVLMPLSFTSLYTSYSAIFPSVKETGSTPLEGDVIGRDDQEHF